MSAMCNYCINKEACETCDKKGWLDKFIPSEEVKSYFRSGYNGVRGYDGKNSWYFETKNPNLMETHSIVIDRNHHCPYCGEKMFHIQANIAKYGDYSTTGYCCICDGARAELEYEKEMKELLESHKKQIHELQSKYNDRLKFDSDKLFEIKQESERKSFKFFSHNYNHFSGLKKIEQIVR